MENYYTVHQLTKWFSISYETIYHHVLDGSLPVKRSGVKPNTVLHIAHSDLTKFLLTVDWLMCPMCQHDHPFERERQTFERLYIHRTNLAQQLNYSELYVRTWITVYDFPETAVRGGWYRRSTVLDWLELHKPVIYHRISGTLR